MRDYRPFWENEGPNILTLRDTTPVAAKNHHCDFCSNVIPKGKKHRYIVQLDMDEKALKPLRVHFFCDGYLDEN
jgi:hypothetical protein